MSNGDLKTEQKSNKMEQEDDRVKVEETSVNLDCVKKELDNGDFDENRYKLTLTFQNIFGESSRELRDNKDSLIGFLDDEVIMETGCIKLEDVKEEEDLIQEIMEQSDCNKCGGSYEGYCPTCSSLSHILNNLTPNKNSDPILNTTPLNMLEIREILMRQAVFALKTLPKGIIMGPFDGIAPIQSAIGLQWKIKDKKFVNDQNGNWMKYIEIVANHASKNLDVFQFGGSLYFETSREIQEGEELLVCYCAEDEVLKLDDKEEFYLIPVKKEKYPKVFACTLCCLGFRLERCLVEHKSKCSVRDHEDFEIIQCHCCNVWLEKQEHHESHMKHCLENHAGLCRKQNLPDFAPTTTDNEEQVHGNDEITTATDVNAGHSTLPTKIIESNNCFFRIHRKEHKEGYFHDENMRTTRSITNEKKHKCSECPYQTNRKGDLKIHLGEHTKHFQCDICKQRFGQKGTLKVHIKNKHLSIDEKKLKCPECPYQTNHKGNFNVHLGTHKDTKHFQCDTCTQRFGYRSSLTTHIKDKHSNTSEKKYKCSDCSYQTNRESQFKVHLDTHTGIKHFQCDICEQRFAQKGNLKVHIKYKHSNTSEKEYKCSDCSYQTNRKGDLKIHLGAHTKHFKCDICKQRFGQKGTLKVHIKNKHSNSNEKEYKCSECSYQTNHKGSLKNHLVSHTGIKHFQCDTCKQKFSYKSSLQLHIKNEHSNTSGKEYKCFKCSYETNHKGNFKIHLVSHTSIKQFQCDICKQRFARQSNLKVHIKNQH